MPQVQDKQSPGEAGARASGSLAARTAGAFGWRLASDSSKLALQLTVQVVLARLLPVDAFGLLAVAMLVINFGSRISEMGTGPAIIQRLDLTDTHIRAGFSLSLLSGALFTFAVWFGAPLAGSIFRAEAATPVLRLIGLYFVISSAGTTAESLLQRRMNYRTLLWIDVIAYAIGYAGVGIGLALWHPNVWALAWATLTQATVRSIMLVVAVPHPMKPCFAGREVRDLLNFGAGMTAARLASFSAQNADYFVVSRWLGTEALGLYSRAYQLMCLPIYQFSSILNVVLFPAYSSIQDDHERLRYGYLASVAVSSLVVFPVLTMLAIVAPELMTGVFGPEWSEAAVPLQILCVAGAAYCSYNLADSLARARGALFLKFLYQLIYAACVLTGALLARPYGITGVAVAVLASTIVAYLLMAQLSLRLTDCPWRPFLAAQLPALAVSAAVATIGLSAAASLRSADLPAFVVCVATMALCCVVAAASVIAFPARFHNPAVATALATARKYGLQMVVGWRARYRPGTA